jgi:hypothetical protein
VCHVPNICCEIFQDRHHAAHALEEVRVEEERERTGGAHTRSQGRRRRSSLDNYGNIIHALTSLLPPLLPDAATVATSVGAAVATAFLEVGINRALNIRQGRWPFDPTNWYGHDMRVWPPSNLVRADGSPRTFSWLFMPIILDMLNIESFPFIGMLGRTSSAMPRLDSHT